MNGSTMTNAPTMTSGARPGRAPSAIDCPKPWAEDAPGLCRDHYREWVAAVAARDAALEAAYGPRRMTDDEPQDDFNRRVDAVFARCKAGQRTPTVVRMIRAPDFLPHPDDQEDFASCLEDLK
jgi:hypothetical protein